MDEELKKQLKTANYKGKFDLMSLISACGSWFNTLKTTAQNEWEVYGMDHTIYRKNKSAQNALALLILELKKRKAI